MNFNILSFVKEQLSGYVIGKMSDFLGENPYKTASALENVLPVVLGGLINKTSSSQGAGQMMDQIKTNGHDGKVFDNLNDIVKEPDAMLDWLSSGSALSNQLFGDKLGAVIDGISSENDIRKTSASSLLSFLSPLILGAAGKHVTGNSLGLSGIMDLLTSNRSVVDQSITPDMKYILGMDEKVKKEEKSGLFKEKVATTQNTVKPAALKTTTTGTNNWSQWLWPLLLTGLLGTLGYYFLGKKSDSNAFSFFNKWGKKDTTALSTLDGDSLKAKLEQRKKEAEVTNKAKALAKAGTSKSTSSTTTQPIVETPSVSKSSAASTSFSSGSGSSSSRQRRVSRGGSDVIEEIDGSGGSYGTSTNYGSSSYARSASSLSSAIASKSLNAEFPIDGISFVDGGYEFTGGSKKELDRIASLLKKNPRAKIFIQGFAMDGDTEDQELSQMRAEWVRYGLIDRGVKSSRIEARGHCQASQSTLTTLPRNKVSMKLTGV